MSLIVNAWLERADPHIQILSGHTGDILLTLGPTAVMHLLEQGDVTIAEFQQKSSLTLALGIYSGLISSADSTVDFALNEPTNTELRVSTLFQ